MTEARFWELVESAEWKNAGKRGYNDAKVKLLIHLSPIEVQELEDMFYEKMNELADIEKRFDREIKGVSDDSWSDLRAHVIGLGEWEYRSTLNDFDRLQKRANDRDFVESFAYAIPSMNDYQYLSYGHYDRMARRYCEELEEVRFSSMWSDEVKAVADKIMDALSSIKNEGNREIIKSMGDDVWYAQWNPTHHGIPNLVHDYEMYIVNGLHAVK